MEPTLKSQADESILEHPESQPLAESFYEEVMEDDLPDWTLPISHKLLCEEQRKDKTSQQAFLKNKNNAYGMSSFSADSSTKRKLITKNDKICVPTSLQT